MNYELAKELKEAGFPQNGNGVYGFDPTPDIREKQLEREVYLPTLSELIEACGDRVISLLGNKDNWRASVLNKLDINWKTGETSQVIQEGTGSTPEEAVARLWLELNKK